jgi:DNA-binding MarR family transcriptional regulator
MNEKTSSNAAANMSAWYGIRSFAERAIAESPLRALDTLSIRLVDWIYSARSSPEPLYVQTIITKSKVASPATLHKCLSALLREGLIQAEVDAMDTRRKVITVTPKLVQAIQELDQKTKRWLQTHPKRS